MNINKVTQEKFKNLCANLRLKGLRKTNTEFLEMAIELLKRDIKK